MPVILALDAALAGSCAGVVTDGIVLSQRLDPAGQAAALAVMARDVMAEAGRNIDLVAVTVGPGSFTGIRAALALAHGIGLGRGVPVVGVTVGEALAAVAQPGRTLWVAIDSKRGRIFLDRHGTISSVALDALPAPDGPVAVAGDAAIAVVSRLAARGADVQLLSERAPRPLGIAASALLPDRRPAQPLYVDPPEARPGPPGRPAPA